MNYKKIFIINRLYNTILIIRKEKNKMTSNKLTKEQIESIKNYGNEIKSLETFVETVRQMPGMYIGHLGNKGFINMFREILQNAVDELMRENSPCDAVKVTYDENAFTVIVEDNGKGIPFKEIIRVFSKQSTSSNYIKVPFHYTSGRHGAGAKVTNALSTKFIVESYVLGEARRVEFNEGFPWNKGDESKELSIPNNDGRQGTMICFSPSTAIMGDIDCGFDDLLGLIKLISPLTKLGSKIYFKAITKKAKEVNIVIENTDGILTYIIDITKSPIIKPIMYSADTGYLRANIAFTYDSDNVYVPEKLMSFSNFCPTDTKESSHVKGFIAGIKRYFTNYMNKIFLNNGNTNSKSAKKKLTIIESDIRTGLRAAIDVAHLTPNFTGQAKEVLSNDDMEEFVKQLTIDSLEQWSKENPQELQKICRYFKDIADIRSKSDDGKIKLTNQYTASHNGLPSKYTPPTLWGKTKVADILSGKVKFEFYIVEGDSAGGSSKNHRYNQTQGIFPIRGKIINCFEATEKKCLMNAEVAGFLAILDAGGPGTGRPFDINKVMWDKVICGADADPDGGHINSLLLRMVLRFCPQLIEAGKFYKAVPPLFSMKVGKGLRYFTTRIDYVQFMQKDFSKKYTITTVNNKDLTNKQIVELLYTNIDYIYELKKIGDRYKIDHSLLELYLFNRNESVEKIGKLINKKFRFMKIKSINKIPTAEGTINERYNTLFMNKRLIDDSSKIIEIMNNNLYLYYKLNGEVASIYDIMKVYETNEPSSITRYKGLGEMDPDELAISTILPGEMGQRVLIQYTMENAIEEINQIRYLESNKNKLLENLNVTRMDVLD